ncbi:hypothetical protein AB4K20DRAFT_1813041, partial [Rhizopus microsporus]
MEIIETYEEKINYEVENIINKYWSFLHENWNIINFKYKHRTEIKNINNINEIKNVLKNKIGYIGVFFFLNILYSNIEYPGPYREVEKSLFLLYHLVSGKSGKYEIERYLPYSTFHSFYKKFWMYEENYIRLNKIINECFRNMFSSILLRIYSARKYNPQLFKH